MKDCKRVEFEREEKRTHICYRPKETNVCECEKDSMRVCGSPKSWSWVHQFDKTKILKTKRISFEWQKKTTKKWKKRKKGLAKKENGSFGEIAMNSCVCARADQQAHQDEKAEKGMKTEEAKEGGRRQKRRKEDKSGQNELQDRLNSFPLFWNKRRTNSSWNRTWRRRCCSWSCEHTHALTHSRSSNLNWFCHPKNIIKIFIWQLINFPK